MAKYTITELREQLAHAQRMQKLEAQRVFVERKQKDKEAAKRESERWRLEGLRIQSHIDAQEREAAHGRVDA